MVKVAISEFRAHMSKYLMYVLEGQEILLTSRGKEIAELRQPVNRQEAARAKLGPNRRNSRNRRPCCSGY